MLLRVSASSRVIYILLALFSATIGCAAPVSPSRVWGLPADEFMARLAEGDRSALDRIPDDDIRDALLLGDDAAFALGTLLVETGRTAAGARLLRLAWETSPEPFRRAALNALVSLDTIPVDSDEFAALAREAIALYPDDPPALLLLSEHYYRTQRYADVLRLTDEASDAIAGLPAGSPVRQELSLQRAVSAALFAESAIADGWVEPFRALYRDFHATPMHSRLWVFLIAQETIRAAFTADELRFFEAKQLLAEGRARDAADRFVESARRVVAGDDALRDLVLSSTARSDLFRSGLSAARWDVAAALESLAPLLSGDDSTETMEYAGRIYRVVGAHAEAVRVLSAALDQAGGSRFDQSLRWYRLSSLVRMSPANAVRQLPESVATIDRPESFSALFLDLADRLVIANDWNSLRMAYDHLESFATDDVLARIALALTAAIDAGQFALQPGAAEQLRARYLQRAADQRADVFAALVAATLLGRDGVDALALEQPQPDAGDGGAAPAAKPAAEPAAKPAANAVVFARTWLRYGLIDRLARELRTAAAAIPWDLRVDASALMAARGEVSRSIAALNWFAATGGRFTAEIARMRYPRAFADAFDRALAAEQVDPWVLYALIREESLFDPLVSSSAGAIGLAQLMPSTASDIAARLRLDGYDLTSPSDSVRIGARYLAMLTSQFGTVARALAAYNAGQGNVRRWERTAPHADELLFHQLIPFPETYNHVRKVVVSAAYYGYLYGDRAPADTVGAIFALAH